MIRILLADDQNMLRGALATMLNLESDFEVSDQASNGEEVLETLKQNRFDIVVMDIEMPKCSGLQAMEQMKAEGRKEKVLMLTTFSKSSYVKKAMRYRADGYLLKDTPSEQLATAIREIVYEGKFITSPEIVYQLTEEEELLNQRELEILRLAEEGLTTKQIAAALFLSRAQFAIIFLRSCKS